MLHIYNTLTRDKQLFTPIDKSNVRLYVCGMTTYDYCHIGHARMLVVFDVVYRYLCELYGKQQVRYIRNITDIDDNIIARANSNNESIQNFTDRFIKIMDEDLAALGILIPNEQPRATLHIPEILTMIQTLLDKKIAYQGTNGDVYYDVSTFPSYGKLSGKILDDLRAGARVDIVESKDDPLDFVLWKQAKENEPSWQSPWGLGRPGWHIECSAMSKKCCGNHFDIHGGGMDLQFPHHENEIAQSEAANGETFVNTWMHNGFVRVDEEKMSKSLDNFFTIRDVLEDYSPEVIRYFILSSHYRSPLNYSETNLDSARAALTTLYTAIRGIESKQLNCDDEYLSRCNKFMDDDFNTPEVLSIMHEIAKKINKARLNNAENLTELVSSVKYIASLLGLLSQQPDDFLKAKNKKELNSGISNVEIEQLINDRISAKENKDWASADKIRDLLQQQGVILEDNANGTSWRRE